MAMDCGAIAFVDQRGKALGPDEALQDGATLRVEKSHRLVFPFLEVPIAFDGKFG